MDRSQETPLFLIRNASVVRGGKTILHVPQLTLHQGQSVAFMGPNGAGKSTLIQLLTRQVLPVHQEQPPVLFQGNARPTLAHVKSYFGVVSASMHDQLRVHLPAIQVVCGGMFGTLGLPQRVTPTAQQIQKAKDAMELLGIGSLANQDVTTMSTGQARRVLLAREMAHDPQAFIFDEPCTGLDPEGMFYIRKGLKHICQQGKELILVTHYAEDIVPEINRVVFIKDALVVADGEKEALMTSERLSDLFDVPLEVRCQDGWYSLHGQY